MILYKNNQTTVSYTHLDAAMDLGRTLADNGIVDGDILDLALPTKAGGGSC